MRRAKGGLHLGAPNDGRMPRRAGRVATLLMLVLVIVAFSLIGDSVMAMPHEGSTLADYFPDWPFWIKLGSVAVATVALRQSIRKRKLGSPRATTGAVVAVLAAIPVGLLANADFVKLLDEHSHGAFSWWATMVSAVLALVAAWITFAGDDDLARRDAEVRRLRELLAQRDAANARLAVLAIAAAAALASSASYGPGSRALTETACGPGAHPDLGAKDEDRAG